MKPLITVLPFALLCLAAACTGGGPSAPAGSVLDTAPEPVEERPPGVPALPGLVGYEVPENVGQRALALADETVELPWADDAENMIVAEISDLIDSATTLVAVECRTTLCGVVIEFPAGGDLSIRDIVGDRMRALFSVSGMGTATVWPLDGTVWIAIYIEIRRLA